MKNTLLTLVIAIVVHQLAFSQVKRQYKDDTFAQTTVVVKEDGSSDTAVLDEIDIDMVGMDQQIRITTESLRPQESAPKVLIIEEKPQEVVAEVPVPVVEEEKAPVEAPKTVAPQTGNKGESASTNRHSSASRSAAGPSGSYTVKSGKRSKKVRFKSKKRKRAKRKRYSCYKF